MNMKISSRDKKLIIALLIFGIAALVFMFVIRPLSTDVTEKRERLDTLVAEMQAFHTQMEGSSTVNDAIAKQQESLNQAQTQIPVERTTLEVITDFEEKIIVLKTQVEGLDYASQTPTLGTERVNLSDGTTYLLNYYSMDVKFMCEDKDTIKSFVDLLQNDRYWNVTSISATFMASAGSTGMWDVSARVAMYSETSANR